jgi:hypothetical protein
MDWCSWAPDPVIWRIQLIWAYLTIELDIRNRSMLFFPRPSLYLKDEDEPKTRTKTRTNSGLMYHEVLWEWLGWNQHIKNFEPSNWNVVSIHADQLLRNCRNKLCRLPKCTWTNLHKYYTRKKGVFFNLSFAAKSVIFDYFSCENAT